MPTWKPVGRQSTDGMVCVVSLVAMAALTSLGTMLPQYPGQEAMARVTFYHLVGWLGTSIGDLCSRKLFKVGFLSRVTDRSICGWREEDAGIGYQVGLEFCHINILGCLTSEGSSEGGHDLTCHPIQVSVGWVFSSEVSMMCHRWPHCLP